MTLHLLGIRHHGPGSARSVVRALDALAPTAVLVELPVDTEAALAWVGDPELVAPVALLGAVTADPSAAAFIPFAEFSPEWQAIRWANANAVAVRAIDVPLAVTLAPAPAGDDELIGPPPADPLRDLALAAGDADPERWWEDVIEHRGDGPPAFEAVAEAMVAARGGGVTSRRELQREAHMRRAIRAARRDGHDVIAVVCGAWHVPALDIDATLPGAASPPTASADAAVLRGMPKVKVTVAWVPWTHRRVMTASGYGAGIDSPGWYRHVFEHPGSDGVARFFVDAARLLRERGHAASPDHLIAATRLADSLAAMRARPRVGLSEVLDAAEAVMGNVDLVRHDLVIGDRIGSVPASAPQVPLARDVARAQKSARLTPRPDPATVEIDVRTPAGLRKSHLLHRFVALGVPWGTLVEGRGSSGTFRETWELRWRPELSVRLIERASYGTTLERAATARLLERVYDDAPIVSLAAVIDTALAADLPDAVEPAVRHLAVRAATDPDVGHLVDTVARLAVALRYGDVRGTDAGALRTVIDGMVVRILAGLGALARSLDDDAATVLVERIASLQGALAMLDHPARHAELPRVLVDLATGAGHGIVQGRATRLLHDGGTWSNAAVQRRLSQALTPGTPPARGAAFVEGFLAGSGSVLVHDVELLGVLDGWVASLSPPAFGDVVALIRRTFGAFEPAERRQLMSMLVGVPVTPTGGFGVDVDAERAAAALATVRHLLGVEVSA